MPVISRQTTKTAYLDLFDNGISTNVVLFVDRFKLQLPKWVLRDFLSLGTIIYPDAPINRRENPERVEIKDAMTERLTAAGFRYRPGHAHTCLPDARTDPDATLEAMVTPGTMTRVDLARAGDPNKMYRMILEDAKEVRREGADTNKMSGKMLIVERGWTLYEVIGALQVRRMGPELDALRKRVAELEAELGIDDDG